jgi:phytoene synthase
VRADIIALYAFNYELARVAEVAHEPLVREIRLTWWAEALDELFDGRPPRRHPVVEALAQTLKRHALAKTPFIGMVEARLEAIDAVELPDGAAVHRQLDMTAGALMGLSATVLDARSSHPAVQWAARAWGLSGLARLRQAGVNRLPAAWDDGAIRARVSAALVEARTAVRDLPVAAFPAVAYAAFAGTYVRGRTPSELEKRLRLTGAVLSGRL